MDIERKSLHAVTIGPEATAGSIPIRAKNKGEKTPSKVPVRQAPTSPAPTMRPTAAGPIVAPATPTKSKRYTKTPQRTPKERPKIKPINVSLKMASPRFFFDNIPVAILRTKIVLHCMPIFPDIPVIKGTKKRTNTRVPIS